MTSLASFVLRHQLRPLAGSCETLDVCSGAKFVCVAESQATVANKLGQSFAEIKIALDSGLAAYDALDLTPFNFSPIAPLVRCPAAN